MAWSSTLLMSQCRDKDAIHDSWSAHILRDVYKTHITTDQQVGISSMSQKPRISRSFPPHSSLITIAQTAARMQNSAPFGILITSAFETVVDKAKRRSRGCVVFLCLGTFQRMRTKQSTNPQSNIYALQRDVGWNEERLCREPDISADEGCMPGIIRRLAGRAPSSMVITSKS